MPVLGLGVYQAARGRPTRNAVSAAFKAGYRLIDTASLYGNEADVGAALADASVPREELFVTTKLWNDDQGFDSALRAFERSRRALGVESVDLYLIHWPVSGRWVESWRALTQILRDGKARAIGVSNFTIAHLEELRASSDAIPAVNQVEFSPFLYQRPLLEYCRRHRIQLEGYSPLTRGRRLDHPTVRGVADRHGVSPAQVLIRWGLQHGVVEIPKSTREDRIRENADVFRFQLSPPEMETLDALNEGFRISWDPTSMT